MTVSAETPIASSVANGVTTVFPYTFTVLLAADLVVQGVLAGVTTTYVLGVDYTISGLGTPSGSVTFFVAPANGTVITRFRESTIERSTDYQDNGDLPADTLNLDFDRVWLALQEMLAGTQGAMTAVRVPNGETVPTLPAAADRANKALIFDALGNPNVSTPASGSAADVLLALANSVSNLQGPALVAYNAALTYGAGTVGRAIKDLQGGNLTSLNNTGNSALGDTQADTVSMGGSMFKDANGNFLIGASSASPWGGIFTNVLEFRNGGALVSVTGSNAMLWTVNLYHDGTNYRYKNNGRGFVFNVNPTSGNYTWYAAPSGTAGNVATIASIMALDATASSSIFSLNNHPTRFESAEQTTPSGAGTTPVAHGGTRAPDIVQAVLRCKITEGGHAVGKEVVVNHGSSSGAQFYQLSADATNIYFQTNGIMSIFNTSNATMTATVANWRLVLKCHWL